MHTHMYSTWYTAYRARGTIENDDTYLFIKHDHYSFVRISHPSFYKHAYKNRKLAKSSQTLKSGD